MPYIIAGVIAVPVSRAREHLGHNLTAEDRPPRITCKDCGTVVEQEYADTSLPCGCRDQEEHDEGLVMQAKHGRGVPKGACVGCFIGDDGLSMHSCYLHR